MFGRPESEVTSQEKGLTHIRAGLVNLAGSGLIPIPSAALWVSLGRHAPSRPGRNEEWRHASGARRRRCGLRGPQGSRKNLLGCGSFTTNYKLTKYKQMLHHGKARNVQDLHYGYLAFMQACRICIVRHLISLVHTHGFSGYAFPSRICRPAALRGYFTAALAKMNLRAFDCISTTRLDSHPGLE